jgi:phage terminase small subunit
MALPKGQNPKELTIKQRHFVQNYCDKSSETFGNATKSYIAAGYKNTNSAAQAACHLLNNSKVSKEIVKFSPKNTEITVKKQEITKEYARNKLIETLEAATKAKDLPSQVACVRMLMQTTGQLSDKLVIDVKGAIQLESHKQQEARRIASIILNQGYLPQSTTQDIVCSEGHNNQDEIEAEFEDDKDFADNDL